MFRNHFKIAIRNLLKNTVYSFINIGGLAIGLMCSILILLWVWDEMSYDKFHKNYDRLYQVYLNQEFAAGIGSQMAVPHPLKEELKSKSPQIKYAVITNWGEGNLLSAGDIRFNKLGKSVSEDFLKMFSFKVIKGDSATALSDPSSIVLTESTAKAFFGDKDPINQLIKVDNNREQKVTAVISDPPKQTSFTFDYLLPFGFYEATQEWVRNSFNNWDNNSFQVYVELNENATEAEANQSIKDLIKNNNKDAQSAQLFLHPMSKWRLYSDFQNGKSVGGSIKYVRLFTVIAIFILAIACINFMNLATARSESRAREVGIRKSVGSRRKELIMQFLGESIFISLLSFLLALLFVELTLPFYNQMVDKSLFIDYNNPWLWVSGVGIVIITGLFAGSYPAFYLSSFQPVKVLKGKVQVGKSASLPRKILVTLQFGFSILLIVGMAVIYQQIQHVKARDIGYDRENLMLLWTTTEIEAGFQTIRNELEATGAVKSVAKSNSPITRIFSSNTVEWPGMKPGPPVSFTTIATEYDYTQTMGIKMLEGRDFSREFKSDSSSIVVNKAAVDIMGLENPVGETIKMWGRKWTIIGVMENVLMGSPYRPVEPLTMIFDPSWSSTITVKLNKTKDVTGAVKKVEDVFKKHNPSYPFEYRFADDEFDAKFKSISLISKLSTLFAILAIIITCLGLFGLASYTAEQRTKEIGIRKVMGASISSLVGLISKDFSKLVLIAFVFSSPLSWWALNSYLEQYPYRVAVSPWILISVGVFALVLTLVIVSVQAMKAAIANPTKSLRSE